MDPKKLTTEHVPDSGVYVFNGMSDKEKDVWLAGMMSNLGTNKSYPKSMMPDGLLSNQELDFRKKKRAKYDKDRAAVFEAKLERLDFGREVAGHAFEKVVTVDFADIYDLKVRLKTYIKLEALVACGVLSRDKAVPKKTKKAPAKTTSEAKSDSKSTASAAAK